MISELVRWCRWSGQTTCLLSLFRVGCGLTKSSCRRNHFNCGSRKAIHYAVKKNHPLTVPPEKIDKIIPSKHHKTSPYIQTEMQWKQLMTVAAKMLLAFLFGLFSRCRSRFSRETFPSVLKIIHCKNTVEMLMDCVWGVDLIAFHWWKHIHASLKPKNYLENSKLSRTKNKSIVEEEMHVKCSEEFLDYLPRFNLNK